MVEVRMTMDEYIELLMMLPSNALQEMEMFDEKPPMKADKPKSKRRKRRPALSRGWKEANQKLRNKNGSLRKGKTQSDVARLAHKLAKKYKK